jgi:hypothetical protein
VKRRVRREAVGKRPDEQPGEQPGETGSHIHEAGFPEG